MQIEFYIPLPPDGFWAALIIYYMAGLFVCLYQSLKNYNRCAHAKAFSNTPDIVGCVFLFIIAARWPYNIAMNHHYR